MSLAAKLIALLEGFSRQQIRGLTPVQRQQLCAACERVVRDCIHEDAAAATKQSGVLHDLTKDGRSRT